MDTTDQQRLEELLGIALRLGKGSAESFLERAEPERPDLRSEVLSLLDSDAGRGELRIASLGDPARVGPYVLGESLGEAPPARLHRGRVAAAPERSVLLAIAGPSPVAARVAGALEEQAAQQAALEDPDLARLLAAGATEDDRLYVAFEPVDGVPLAELADTLRLTLAERIGLVREVALVVERAHAAGIAPLGLLPWSILGTWRGGRPGVALIAADPWPLLALLDPERPAPAELLACLDTSAPEALRGEARGVATDLFALGALLYHQATGTPPLGLRQLAGGRGLREVLRIAERVETCCASLRVAGLGVAAERVAEERSCRPAALVRDLELSLDELLERTLSRDPARRPATAADLARELGAAERRVSPSLLGRARAMAWRLRGGPRASAPEPAAHRPEAP